MMVHHTKEAAIEVLAQTEKWIGKLAKATKEYDATLDACTNEDIPFDFEKYSQNIKSAAGMVTATLMMQAMVHKTSASACLAFGLHRFPEGDLTENVEKLGWVIKDNEFQSCHLTVRKLISDIFKCLTTAVIGYDISAPECLEKGLELIERAYEEYSV